MKFFLRKELTLLTIIFIFFTALGIGLFFSQKVEAACYLSWCGDNYCDDWTYDCYGYCPNGYGCDCDWECASGNCSGGVCVSGCSSGWFCSGSYKYYQYSDCSTAYWTYCDYGCSNGSCNPPPSCSDSDGYNFYSYGYCSDSYGTYYDFCSGNYAYDNYCSGGYCYGAYYNCDNDDYSSSYCSGDTAISYTYDYYCTSGRCDYDYYSNSTNCNNYDGCSGTTYYDYYCSNGYCTYTSYPNDSRCLKPQGSTCTSDNECQSGYCVDGYCCNWACDGTCMHCDYSADPGTCYYYLAGEDPENECYGTGTCGGTCNGSGSCQYPSTSVTCSSLQDCDYLNYYYQSPSGDSPTSEDWCWYRDYADSYRYCDGAGSCAVLNCSSYEAVFQYECGTCKYIPSNYCTGDYKGSCANYSAGTSCGTNKECDGNGNCVTCYYPTGSISASKTSVETGETFTISITGNDDHDVYYLTYNKDSDVWNDTNKQKCIGSQTTCTKSWDIVESTAGTYTYYGWVQDSDNSGGHGCSNDHRASIGSVTVTVTKPDNPPTGTLDVSPTSVCPNDTVTVTITGNDDNDIDQLQAYYGGSWHTQWCDGIQTSCTKTWTTSESTPGIYTYQGYVYDSAFQGAWTTPDSVDVTVPDCSGTDRYCSEGSCISCNGSYRDCDGDPLNGCEVDTDTDPNNCGSCGNVCSGGVCSNGSCMEGDCDDACSNQGYPEGCCGSSGNCAEICVAGGYSIETVNIHDQGECTETSFPTIKSCYCCQPIVNTKIDCYFGADTCIFDKLDVSTGESVWVCGILRTTDGTVIPGKTISFWVSTDGGYSKVFDVGTTDSNGYVCRSWTPDSTYEGVKKYVLFFAGDGAYNQSQTSEYELNVYTPSVFPTCNRATPSKIGNTWSVTSDCWYAKTLCPGTCTIWCSDDRVGEGFYPANNTTILPKGSWKITATMNNINTYVKCHGSQYCIGTYICYSHVIGLRLQLFLDGVLVNEAWRNDGAYVEGGRNVHHEASLAVSPLSITEDVVCDKDEGCVLEINRDLVEMGWSRKFWSGEGDYYYAQATADVTVTWEPIDNTSPTVELSCPSGWLKEGYYTISISDTDPESGLNLNECKYKIEEWTVDGGSYVKDVTPTTGRTCNGPVGINVGPGSPLTAEGPKVYKFIATAKNNVDMNATSSCWLSFDFTPPTTEIK